MDPCSVADGWGLTAFIVLAIVSHARGTTLLLKEAFGLLGERRRRNRRCRGE